MRSPGRRHGGSAARQRGRAEASPGRGGGNPAAPARSLRARATASGVKRKPLSLRSCRVCSARRWKRRNASIPAEAVEAACGSLPALFSLSASRLMPSSAAVCTARL
ncbi:hypothetical protein LBW89_15745 [Paenibacillus sp. alder61]|nr:hypothetical protein [Paenibacillus sp. alder61]